VNDASSRFCIDCGKPLTPSAARVIAAAGHLSNPPATPATVSSGLVPELAPSSVASAPARVSSEPAPAPPEVCAHCGQPIGDGAAHDTGAAQRAGLPRGPRLELLSEPGDVVRTFAIDRGELTVGRSDGDIRFAEDVYLSPLHAQFSLREGQLWVRDLGSRNGSWVFLDGPCRLHDGDVLLVGSQLLRFRRLGYPGPHPPEADATRRMGSATPAADVAELAQMRGDGSVRDTFHLSPGRNVLLGRESGDWVFPYDQTMSGRHAEIRSEDIEFVVHDAGSRNGIAIAVRGERLVREGQRVLLGDQLLRVQGL
jgi:pSer/pThr/pTyr-binding forkhead associated (FHA) protein